jgi:hypothetical protein
MMTMVLGGLWHGASWNFILWGTMHGIMLAIDKLRMEYLPAMKGKIWSIVGWVFTFHFVSFCWIFFRAQDFTTSWQVIHQIESGIQWNLLTQWFNAYTFLAFLLVLAYGTHALPNRFNEWITERLGRMSVFVQALLLVGLIFLVMQVKTSDIQPFIYFQF